MKLSKDLKELLLLFEEKRVEYLLIGGVAVNHYGYPRYTKDLDLWIRPTKVNAGRVMAVLNAFGMGSLGVSIQDLTFREGIIQLGVAPNRIDIIMQLKGVDEDAALARGQRTKLDGIELNIIHKDDLIAVKETVARPQDLADAHHLKLIKD